MKRLIYSLYLLTARLMAAIYGADGLNLIFKIAPTGVIINLLKRHGAQVGHSVRIKAPFTIHNADLQRGGYYKNLRIESRVFIGREAFLDLAAPIEIGRNVCISHGLKVMTHTDAGDSIPGQKQIIIPSNSSVVFEEGGYIGAYVVILEGVTIGKGAIVGAGSLVNKPLEPYSINVGNPARKLRTYQV